MVGQLKEEVFIFISHFIYIWLFYVIFSHLRNFREMKLYLNHFSSVVSSNTVHVKKKCSTLGKFYTLGKYTIFYLIWESQILDHFIFTA